MGPYNLACKAACSHDTLETFSRKFFSKPLFKRKLISFFCGSQAIKFLLSFLPDLLVIQLNRERKGSLCPFVHRSVQKAVSLEHKFGFAVLNASGNLVAECRLSNITSLF